MSHSVFISHSSHDNEITFQIVSRLESMNISCWCDRNSLDSDVVQGLDYASAIVEAIDNASIFILVLSKDAMASDHVKNEIALAHNHIKDGLIIVPFRIMQEDPESTVRYFLARTNFVDARIPPLDLRIEALCNLVSDALSSMLEDADSIVAQREALHQLDSKTTNKSTDLAKVVIDGVGAQKLTRFLKNATSAIDEYYRESNDPLKTYTFFHEYQIETAPLASIAEVLYGNGMYSIALGSLYKEVSYFLINSGKTAYVQDARTYLEKAITCFNKVFDISPDSAEEVIEQIIYCQWLLSITHKQEKNYGIANSILEGLLLYAEEMKEEYDLPYDKTVLLPKRELAIVNMDGDLYDELLNDIPNFEHNKEEVFFTLRRAFEFYVYEENYEKADELRERMEEAYEAAKDTLYGIYYYAMQVNIHQFYCHFDRPEEAFDLYRWLVPELKSHHFDRYERKVEKDHQNYVQGRRLKGYSDV